MKVLNITVLGIFLTVMSSPLIGANPYTKPNNSWITISGTVDNVSSDRFQLDYGDGKITVEMDDGDRDADAYKLLRGDKVMVSGKIDRDLFEKSKIEAGSVFVENIGTTFYASSIDEEDPGYLVHYQVMPIIPSSTIVRGQVTKVDGREFVLQTGDAELKVNTASMKFNPMDDKGYLKIDKGDQLTVYGRMAESFFSGRVLRADSIIEMRSSKKSKGKSS